MELKDLFLEDFDLSDIYDLMAVKGPVTTNLQENLMKYKKDDLLEIADVLEMDIPKKLNKDAFTKAMVECYKDEGILAAIYINLSDLELFLLKTLMTSKKPLIGPFRFLAIKFLVMYGFVHLYKQGDAYRVIISDDMKSFFQKLDEEALSFIREAQQFVRKYTGAAINLYGVISKDVLIKQYKAHIFEKGDEQLDDDILEVLFVGQLVVDGHYFFDGQYFISKFFDEVGIESAYEIANNGKPYYQPDLDSFLLYDEMGYLERNHAFDAMEKFVLDYITKDPNKADDFMMSLQYHCEYGQMNDVIEELHELNFEFNSEAQVNHFMMLYQDFTNNHRMWLNHGHTPNELTQVLRKNLKVGRNDSCPCGSGKKYKKCCGNHLSLVQ